MKRSNSCAVLGAAALLLVINGCNSGTKTNPVQIQISKADAKNCQVDIPSADLSINGANNVAQWKSLDNNYTVLFSNGNPFNSNPTISFPVNPPPVTVSPRVKFKGYFEYSINDQNGQECKSAKDPGLNVKD